jgi:hypothetical protein
MEVAPDLVEPDDIGRHLHRKGAGGRRDPNPVVALIYLGLGQSVDIGPDEQSGGVLGRACRLEEEAARFAVRRQVDPHPQPFMRLELCGTFSVVV